MILYQIWGHGILKNGKGVLSAKMLGLALCYVSVMLSIGTYKKKYNTSMHDFKIEIQRR